jgi:hypothetical protein
MTYLEPSFDLDEILARRRVPGTKIELRPGTYTSRGSGGPTIAAGVTLEAKECVIKLVDPVKTNPYRPWVDFPWLEEGAKIIGGTWDLGNHGGIAQSGFYALGSCQIIGATILGLFGRRHATDAHPVKEVFAFCQPNGGTSGTFIEGLRATPLRPDCDDYVAGVYTNDTGGSEVVACDMELGPHGQFAYSCAHRTLFRFCSGEAARFFYTDTGGFDGDAVDCHGRAHWSGVSFAGPGPHRQLAAMHCDIDCTGGRAVEFDNSGPAVVVLVGGKWDAEYRLATNSKHATLVISGAEVTGKDHGGSPIVFDA